MSIAVHHGDCREIIPALGVTVDAVVTDPPYHLGPQKTQEIGWPSWTTNTKAARGSAKAGFMGQQWDGGDIAFRPKTWTTIGAALRPGGFLLAFGGTRTWHRMACAIEDAGFVIQDTIAWLYGSGFPKNRAMLKPAFEPIVLAYKPGGKRTMQVDECRVGADVVGWNGNARRKPMEGDDRCGAALGLYAPGEKQEGSAALGRWPANLCHDGSDEVVAAFPESAGPNGRPNCKDKLYASESPIMGRPGQRPYAGGYLDTGSAARFFFSSKAGSQDRWGSKHPTVKPVELMKWLVALVCPPGGTVLDPFAGSGTTAVAALGTGRNAILIEREDQYVGDIRERVAFYEGGGSHSVQAKNRNRKTDHGPLFAEPEFDEDADAARSYDAAIHAIGERVKAGEPLPTGGYFGGEE